MIFRLLERNNEKFLELHKKLEECYKNMEEIEKNHKLLWIANKTWLKNWFRYNYYFENIKRINAESIELLEKAKNVYNN